jgi:hypothetical protein
MENGRIDDLVDKKRLEQRVRELRVRCEKRMGAIRLLQDECLGIDV